VGTFVDEQHLLQLLLTWQRQHRGRLQRSARGCFRERRRLPFANGKYCTDRFAHVYRGVFLFVDCVETWTVATWNAASLPQPGGVSLTIHHALTILSPLGCVRATSAPFARLQAACPCDFAGLLGSEV
jgi:hypothetical protein